METNGAKFLFNVYIPKDNNETTEIDVLLICSKGIFVFESKNYSGWIFGSEYQKNWYQILPAGRGKSHKESFYNPIMQNRSHIKHLKNYLNEQIPMHSIIVFSDRCKLKKIDIKNKDIRVINRYDVASAVSSICKIINVDLLSDNNISEIYNKLYPLTQVDKIAKAQHIANIQNNLSSEIIQNSQPVYTSPNISTTETPELIENEQVNVESNNSDNVDELDKKTDVEVSDSCHTESSQQVSQSYKCPKCNGNLVLRSATRGANTGKQFYGCSNYPKCKYIQNII